MERGATTAERRLSEQIRHAAICEIDARALPDVELASVLGLSQTALYLLRLKERWPLAVSVYVAESLGLHIDVTIGENGDNGASAEARAS